MILELDLFRPQGRDEVGDVRLLKMNSARSFLLKNNLLATILLNLLLVLLPARVELGDAP